MTIDEITDELNKTVFTNMSTEQYIKGENIPKTDTFNLNLKEAIHTDYCTICRTLDFPVELHGSDIMRFVEAL